MCKCFSKSQGNHIVLACNCHRIGSQSKSCTYNGKCACNVEYTGDKCDSCQIGYFGLPICEGKKYHTSIDSS